MSLFRLKFPEYPTNDDGMLSDDLILFDGNKWSPKYYETVNLLPDGRDSCRQGRARLGKIRKCGKKWSEDKREKGDAKRWSVPSFILQ